MYRSIDLEGLEGKLSNGGDVKLIDVLSPEDYEDSHIKGAINIPLAKIGREAKKRFDKEDEIIVYCANIDCPASAKAAEKLDKLGFVNVYDYEEGKKGWKDAGKPMAKGDESE